jgi:hypothetical protein
VADPIPQAVWDRIVEFLAAGKTGHITLWVNQGHVTDAALEERVRPKPVVDSSRTRGV